MSSLSNSLGVSCILFVLAPATILILTACRNRIKVTWDVYRRCLFMPLGDGKGRPTTVGNVQARPLRRLVAGSRNGRFKMALIAHHQGRPPFDGLRGRPFSRNVRSWGAFLQRECCRGAPLSPSKGVVAPDGRPLNGGTVAGYSGAVYARSPSFRR